MKSRVGLSIETDAVRIVALRRSRVVWWGEHSLEAGGSLAAAVATLLGSAPRGRLVPRVTAALGVAYTQAKEIKGLPPGTDAKLATRILRESTGRFFLKNGGPLTVSHARATPDGAIWAAAFEQGTVDAVVEGCRAARCRPAGIVPSAVALASALRQPNVTWREGDLLVHVEHRDGFVTQVSRSPAGAEVPGLDLPTELTPMGADAARFLVAYGAAMVPVTQPLILRPGRSSLRTPASAGRARTALAVAALGLCGPFVLPAIRAIHQERRADVALMALAPRRREAEQAMKELERVTAALDEVARFQDRRLDATELLQQLSAALPEPGAIVALQIDSSTGRIVALVPSAATVVKSLGAVPGVRGPEIVGPVTRERVGDRVYERVTVQVGVPAAGRAVP